MKEQVFEYFLFMELVKSVKAVDLFNLLDSVLKEHNVRWKNGWNSDNCNAMMGQHNLVASHIILKHPAIYLQGCVCHMAALTACKAAKHIPGAVEDLLKDVFSHFQQSSKRLLGVWKLPGIHRN